MKNWLRRLWREEDGVLSFEWTLLASLVTVGAVSGLAAVRDATIDEMGDLSQAMLSLDQSYTIQAPLVIGVHNFGLGGSSLGGFGFTSAASSSSFVDASSYADCQRGHMKVNEFPRRMQGGSIDEAEGRLLPGSTPVEPLPQ